MENNYYSSSYDSSMDYSDATTDSEEMERFNDYRREAAEEDWIGENPDHHRGFETPHGSLSEDESIEESFSEEDSNIATSGEQIDNLSEPITDDEENDTQTVPRPRPVRRIEMFSDEEDMWEFDDGTVHQTPEGDSDDDSHNYSDPEQVTLTEEQYELIDNIDLTNEYTKSKIVTATCSYTLEDDKQCIRCYKCGETYSAEGLIENYSYHLPMERLCCPTCKTPIESALLIRLLGKDEVKSIIEKRWDEKLSMPIFEVYIDTLKLLHDAGMIYPSEEKLSIISAIRSVMLLMNRHERPIPIECPHKLQLEILSLFNITQMYRNRFDEDPDATKHRILRIPFNYDGTTLTYNNLRDLLYKTFEVASNAIIFVIRMAKMICNTILQNHPAECHDLLQEIDNATILFNGWRTVRNLSVNTPSEIIGMIYQQITETGTITPSLIKLINDRSYSIFKRHGKPLHVLLDTIIDALVPDATTVQRKMINEIIKCVPEYNPFKGCPIRFLKSLSKGESTCTCGGPIISHTCLLCDQHYCEHCEEPINETHQCSPDKLSTIKELHETTVKCPKCFVRIQKSEGCDHMYCTHCRSNFDWITGKLIKESEQTNDLYVNSLSSTEQEYIYYIRALIEDYEAYNMSDVAYHKSALCHELSLIHAGIYDGSLGAPALALSPHLNALLKYRIAKETIAALRPAVANAIQNTLDIFGDTLNDYEADAVAERIVQKGIVTLREIL